MPVREAPYRVVLVGSAVGLGLWGTGYVAFGLPFPFLGILPWVGRELAIRLYFRSWLGEFPPSPSHPVWRRYGGHLVDSGWTAGMLVLSVLYVAGAPQSTTLWSAAAVAIVVAGIATASDAGRTQQVTP